MAELRERVDALSFPVVLAVFLALYVTSLFSGVEPEVGLLRAGGAGLAMAVVGRLALKILEHEPAPDAQAPASSGQPPADGRTESARDDPRPGPEGVARALTGAGLASSPRAEAGGSRPANQNPRPGGSR